MEEARLKFAKPEKPLALERHERKLARKKADDDVKAEAKRRDGNRCRWPHCEHRAISQVIDAAHAFQAAGMGGDPTLVRTERKHLIALCRLHHRTGAYSLHNANLRIEALTSDGADGPCQFLRHTSEHGWYIVAMELSVGILARD